jgi:hypothetical protein
MKKDQLALVEASERNNPPPGASGAFVDAGQ